jgi:hypothetical protein
MKINDLLGHILQRLDMVAEGSNFFTADEVAEWPRGACDFFVHHRMLCPTTPAQLVECDGCEDRCFMPVSNAPIDAPRTPGSFIICNQRDDIGRVAIEPDRLKRWKVDLGRLAGVLSKLLGIDRTPNELILSRLWDLGKVTLASGLSEVFLARGLGWTDTEETFGNNREVKESVAPLIFTPWKTADGFFPHAAVFSLSRMLRVQNDRLVIDREGIARVIAAKPQPGTITRNVFRKEGQYWTISFEGNTFRLRHSKGLQYLAFLLPHPGEEFHAQRILSEVEGKTLSPGHGEATKMKERQFLDDGLNVSPLGDAGPLLDNQAKKEYKKRLDELRKELEEAKEFHNIEQADRVQEEIEAIEDALTAAFGLGGRARKGSDSNERARKTISKAISRTLALIKENDLALWRHLENALNVGLFPSYNPHPPVNWTT